MKWLSRAFKGGARGSRSVDELLRSALLAVLDRDLDRAEDLLGRALRLESKDVEPYMALARLFRLRGEVGRAIRIHQNLLLRTDLEGKQRIDVLLGLGADFRQGGFLRRAIATYEEIVAEEPRNAEALGALEKLLAEAHEYPRAIEMAQRRARRERVDGAGEQAALYVQMAEAQLAEGKSSEARRSVKQALRKDRRSVEAWRVLGELEAERGRDKAALAAWARVPALNRMSGPLVYRKLETAHAALGHARDFEAFLRRLLEEEPADADGRLALARTLAGRGEIQEAVSELRRILARSPEDLEVREALGRILLSEGREVEALTEYGALLDALESMGLLAAREKLE